MSCHLALEALHRDGMLLTLRKIDTWDVGRNLNVKVDTQDLRRLRAMDNKYRCSSMCVGETG